MLDQFHVEHEKFSRNEFENSKRGKYCENKIICTTNKCMIELLFGACFVEIMKKRWELF